MTNKRRRDDQLRTYARALEEGVCFQRVELSLTLREKSRSVMARDYSQKLADVIVVLVITYCASTTAAIFMISS